VAVGAGLLLPALAKSKAKAQGISCLNNMKQIALALHLFASDHNGKLPWQVSEKDGGSMEFIKPRSAKNALLDADGKPIFDENSRKHIGTLKKHLGGYRALTCPTLGNKPVPNKLTDKYDVSYWLLTDKKLNLLNVKNPATTIILVCPHHQDAYGAAFADGHCEIMKWPRVIQRFKDQDNPIELPTFPQLN
jgi:hypothetical protein